MKRGWRLFSSGGEGGTFAKEKGLHSKKRTCSRADTPFAVIQLVNTKGKSGALASCTSGLSGRKVLCDRTLLA